MKRRALPALGLAVLACGCAAPVPASVQPGLFPRGGAPKPATSRIALVVPPQVAAIEGRAERSGGAVAPDLLMPIGRIVEAAVRAALDDDLGGAPPGLAVMVDGVHFEYKVRVLWLLPMPYVGMIGQTEPGGQVRFDVSLFDAHGELAWRRSYDTGREVWKPPWLAGEDSTHALVRLTHEAAWRLAKQLTRDIGDWLAAERLKPREL